MPPDTSTSQSFETPTATLSVPDSTDPGEIYLVVLDQFAAVAHEIPPSGSLIIGRGHSCDVRIDNPAVSRCHARLDGGRPAMFVDLGSSRGSKVAGARVRPGQPVEVSVGTPIEVASTLLMLQRAPGDRELGEAGSPPMERLKTLIERVAPSEIPVLILGETGAGKEVCAEWIHRLSRRSAGPFIRINCAAISPQLLESELFGHEKGSFTGADLTRQGMLETAHSGTALLDEIGDLDLPLQRKLLRVLERGVITRVGSNEARSIDVRFLAATHRDLRRSIARGEFREDLYYRIAGVTVEVPPLRERVAEIGPLARRILGDLAAPAPAPVLSDGALKALTAHPFPGNIRELRNVMTRALALCRGQPIGREHLGLDAVGGTAPQDAAAERRKELLDVLLACGWNQTQAARQLGIARGTLRARMDALGLRRPQS